MTNKKTTKRALLSSVLSLILCMSMLIGTTFAWFTDSVTSTGNRIQSGTLQVDLLMDKKETGNADDYVSIADGDGDIFSEATGNGILWEPGKTEIVYLAVSNEGNLALKYNIVLDITDNGLAGALEYAIMDGAKATDLAVATKWADIEAYTGAQIGDMPTGRQVAAPNGKLEEDGIDYFALAVHMKEEAGNEYQDKDIVIDLQVQATQATVEEDSFNNQYDKDAFYVDALVDTNEELKSAIVAQKKVIAIDGDLTYDWGGDSYGNSKALLLDGLKLVGFDGNDSITFAGYGSANPIVGATFRNITVKDVTVGDDESSWEHGYLEIKDVKAYNVVFDCTIMTSGDTTITNCVIDNAIPSWYSIWVEGGNTTIKNTTFTGTRAVKIHEAYQSDVKSVVIDNCTFKELNEKPGVVIGTINADTKVTIKNSNFINCQAGDQGKYIYESDTDVTTFGFVEENNVITNKTIVTVNDAATLKTALTSAGQAGSGNTYIEFNGDDIDMTGQAWTPIKVDGYHGADIVTIDGNGAIITGLSAPLFAGGFAGGSGIVIKNLTIADSNIISANTIGSGAFIESVDSMNLITLENCHLLNSTVTGGDGSRTGGLLGWTAGYNNVNDGPVKTYVTITDCSVIGCTITCNGSVGAIYGHAGNNAWTYSTVKDCTVKGNKLISTKTSEWRVGVVVGTANVGELTIENIIESGNTLEQTGLTAPEGQSNLYGRFVPGTTGKLVINGTEIK